MEEWTKPIQSLIRSGDSNNIFRSIVKRNLTYEEKMTACFYAMTKRLEGPKAKRKRKKFHETRTKKRFGKKANIKLVRVPGTTELHCIFKIK